MLRSLVTTAWRHLRLHGVDTALNVLGLACAMVSADGRSRCVGPWAPPW